MQASLIVCTLRAAISDYPYLIKSELYSKCDRQIFFLCKVKEVKSCTYIFGKPF